MENGKGLKMDFIKKILCKISSHKLKMAGACPFTGKTYNYCERCGSLVEKMS